MYESKYVLTCMEENIYNLLYKIWTACHVLELSLVSQVNEKTKWNEKKAGIKKYADDLMASK